MALHLGIGKAVSGSETSAVSLDVALPLLIRMTDYPGLRRLAWQVGEAVDTLSPREAFGLYTRNVACCAKRHWRRCVNARAGCRAAWLRSPSTNHLRPCSRNCDGWGGVCWLSRDRLRMQRVDDHSIRSVQAFLNVAESAGNDLRWLRRDIQFAA